VIVMAASGPGDGRTTIYPALRYREARAPIAFLKEAFGFTELAVYAGEDGTVHHSELAYGNGAVMLGTAQADTPFGRAAKDLGPVSLYLVVEDPGAHFERAVEHDAEIVLPLIDQDYGSRDHTARDPEGNLWIPG
jgi:uncharacterized glyoxalase superfamily protein PhnB